MPMTKIGQATYNNVVSPIYLLQGNATRDAESRPINDKAHTQVSIAAGEDKDGVTQYITVNGWRTLAPLVGLIKKGDSVLVVGRLKTREYNNNIYYDLDADFVAKNGAGLIDEAPLDKTAQNVRVAEQFAKHFAEQENRPKDEDFELVEDDDSLPFD